MFQSKNQKIMNILLHDVPNDKLPLLVEMAKALGVKMEQLKGDTYNQFLNEALEEGEQSGIVNDFEPDAFLAALHKKHL